VGHVINVKSNIREVLSFTERFSRQYEFAVAVALTETVKAVQAAMPAELEKALDNPTRFTKSGFFVVPASKDRLTATVGAKDKQAQYLRWQVEGGTRSPTRKALRLPSNVKLDQYGNVPAGLIRQLVVRAQASKRATKTQSRRFGVSQELDLFYGEPGDGRPAGIYKRVVVSAMRHQLVPIIVFPQQPARYDARFDFRGKAAAITRKTFEPTLRRAWARAKATAR
jgi:hypothetical protein